MFTTSRSGRLNTALIVALIVATALFRVARARYWPELPNFSPVMAMAFCGGLFLPGALAWGLPLAVLVISDLALAAMLGYPAFGVGQSAAWLSALIAVAAGRTLAHRGSFGLGRFATVLAANAVLFYVLTNGVCWLTSPAYPGGLAGLWQSLTAGLPGYPPTWVFFRNSLFSDFLFAAVMLAVWVLAARPAKSPAGARAVAA